MIPTEQTASDVLRDQGTGDGEDERDEHHDIIQSGNIEEARKDLQPYERFLNNPVHLMVMANQLEEVQETEQADLRQALATELRSAAQAIHGQSAQTAEENVWQPTAEELIAAKRDLDSLDPAQTVIIRSPAHIYVIGDSFVKHGLVDQGKQMMSNAQRMHKSLVDQGKSPFLMGMNKQGQPVRSSVPVSPSPIPAVAGAK